MKGKAKNKCRSFHTYDTTTELTLCPPSRMVDPALATLPRNLVTMPVNRARRISQLYGTTLPHDRLALYWYINQKVIVENVRQQLFDMALMSPSDFYHPDIIPANLCEDWELTGDIIENGPQGMEGENRTKHHIIPSSLRKQFCNVHGKDKANTLFLPKSVHRAWHEVFFDQHPQEILGSMLAIDHPVYAEPVAAVLEILGNQKLKHFYESNFLS